MVELTLKWDKFGLSQGLHSLMMSQELVDVTIMCQGEFLQAHKSVLAACSEQFRIIFKTSPDKNPIIVLKGIELGHIKNILEFMYLGEVTVLQDDIADFLTTAETLGVSALSKSKGSAPQKLSDETPEEVVKTETQNSSSRSRLKTKKTKNNAAHSSSTDCIKPSPPSEISEPTDIVDENEELEILEMDCDEIKTEFDSDLSDEEYTADPLEEDDTNTSVPHSNDQQGNYLHGSNNVSTSAHGDPGPSTSNDWHESPAAFETSETSALHNFSTQSPINSQDTEQDESLQPGPSASQGYRLFGDADLFTDDKNRRITRSQTSDKIMTCATCEEQFRTRHSLITHIKNLHLNVVSCPKCFNNFKNRQALNYHYFKYHQALVRNRLFKCKHCGICFGLKRTLKEHKTHYHGVLAVPHKCHICYRQLKNWPEYLQHMKFEHQRRF